MKTSVCAVVLPVVSSDEDAGGEEAREEEGKATQTTPEGGEAPTAVIIKPEPDEANTEGRGGTEPTTTQQEASRS